MVEPGSLSQFTFSYNAEYRIKVFDLFMLREMIAAPYYLQWIYKTKRITPCKFRALWMSSKAYDWMSQIHFNALDSGVKYITTDTANYLYFNVDAVFMCIDGQ